MLYTELTKKALKISFDAHKDQVDKSGMPYVFHPFHLAEKMDDEYSVCVALLHDVAEDTDITTDDLAREGFPQEVIDALLLLTHDDSVPYMDYVRKIKTNPLATKVKLADLEHNSDLTRLDKVDDAALRRADKYRQAMFLLRFTEPEEKQIEIIPALETECCHVKVPRDYHFCTSCGKRIADAKACEMEYDRFHTVILCRECRAGIEYKDLYCGYCGAKGPAWQNNQSERLKNKIRGCLIGGAAGDALGYAVEFIGEREIFREYGLGGIREYSLDRKKNKALISDDTQMTLFTAEAMTNWLTAGVRNGNRYSPAYYAAIAYQDWLETQESPFELANPNGERYPKRLKQQREMFACRAPGITCLSALKRRKGKERQCGSFIADEINNSKGCGGVMRVAPVGMLQPFDIGELDMEGAEIAAITHCHSLGYMPAALFTHIIHRLLFAQTYRTLKETVQEALDSVAVLFRRDDHIRELVKIIQRAIKLSENNMSDLDNIHELGEGWVAEEALAIAVYCCLRHPFDFSMCIIAAVNHKGDSDSTGAIAGNILGAALGYDRIDTKWKEKLELSDVILRVADDLHGALIENQMPGNNSF